MAFASTGNEYVEHGISLYAELISHPSATSMSGLIWLFCGPALSKARCLLLTPRQTPVTVRSFSAKLMGGCHEVLPHVPLLTSG